MRLLIYEHASGGGLADESIPSDVLSEGFGMLRTIIADFKEAGHNVTAFLNSRLVAFSPPVGADYVVPIDSFEEAESSIERTAGSFDAAYVIGPETNHTLQSLITNTEEAGLKVLNSSAAAIDKAANKLKLCQSLKEKGIRTPETALISTGDGNRKIEQVLEDTYGFPMVFKPLDGVGCCGLSIVIDKTQIPTAIAKMKRESGAKDFIVQEYVLGTPASVSLIATGSKALPISLNQQTLYLSGPDRNSSYKGGSVPLDSPFIDDAFRTARDAVESIHGLEGYIGVDLVLTEKGPVVIEVNPRLTTSYIGLKPAVNINIGQAIVNAVLHGNLPQDVGLAGYSCFSKVEVAIPTIHALQNSCNSNEIVSPPFPLRGKSAHALLLCHRSTLQESGIALRKAEKHFLTMLRRTRPVG